MRSKLLSIPAFLAFLTILTGIWVGYNILVPYPAAQELTVFIPKGSSLDTIARLLKRSSIIRNRHVFYLYAIFSGISQRLQWGEYAFLRPVNIHQVLRKLVRGEVKVYFLTLKEGETIYDLSDHLEKLKFFPKEKTLSKLQEHTFIRSLDPRIPQDLESIEGFLYPETYKIEKRQDLKGIVHPMVQECFRHIDKDLLIKAATNGFNLKELVTLASIIEKETPHKEEMPLIASVFHNRLKRGMPLQADPTAVYGLNPPYQGPVLPIHLRQPSPYNTYLLSGLPKGPICNPSLSALQAAADPPNTPYLYFLANKNSHHTFSKSYKEHVAHILRLRTSGR
jgi:UPF0755 protein